MRRPVRPTSAFLLLILALAACGGRAVDAAPEPQTHPCMDERYLALLQNRDDLREEDRRELERLDLACRTARLQPAATAGDSARVAERKENYRWLFGMALGAGVLYLMTAQY